MLAYSIRRSDLDLRKTFYSNIVLSGGSTLFKGVYIYIYIYIYTMIVANVDLILSLSFPKDSVTGYSQRSRS